MTVAVIRFGGSNCDRDSRAALEHVGVDAEIVWHEDGVPPDATAAVLPGGFSYGDYLRAGAIAARSPVLEELRAAVTDGLPLLGICNGAQVATEAGLVPGAFTVNRDGRFRCEHVHLRVETTGSRWTRGYEPGEVIELPIAHGEGRFEIDDTGLERLVEQDRVLFRYCEPDGTVTEAANPNGSRDNIAGLLGGGGGDEVAVLMPHPERATLPDVGGVDGQAILTGLA